MASGGSSTSGLFGAKRNVNLSKWNFLFDEPPSEWISFKPKLGLCVYPCYPCRNMFASKSSFLDHVNRRTVILKYACPECKESLTFYNGCAFLLHARKHFSLKEGTINLSNIEICVLPFGLAGLPPNPQNIPMLYDEDEDLVEPNIYINSQFYSPSNNLAGSQIIYLRPKDLVFLQQDDNSVPLKLVMLQICAALPKCQFVELESYKKARKLYSLLEERNSILSDNLPNNKSITNEPEVTIKIEPDDTFTLPVISKIESLNKEVAINGEPYPKCSECKETVKIPMAQHFLNQNLPIDTTLNCDSCKFIAPTKCSLLAHARIHTETTPHVCPECGKTFDAMKTLKQHLDDVCFHLSKQVKFRCPGKRCGKLFSLTSTYESHFENHLKLYYDCKKCNIIFRDLTEAREHCLNNSGCTLTSIFDCTVCNLSSRDLIHTNFNDHIQWHTSDRSRCMYVYACKSCRASFRSTNTFAFHQLKCAKMNRKADSHRHTKQRIEKCTKCGWNIFFLPYELAKECRNCSTLNYIPQQRVVKCTNCGWNILFLPYELAKECRNCSILNYLPQDLSIQLKKNINALQKSILNEDNNDNTEFTHDMREETESCILCNTTMLPGTRVAHLEACKYSNPTVSLIKYSDKEFLQLQLPQVTSSSSEVDSLESSPNTENDSSKSSSSSSKPEEIAKKRRRRLPFSNRNKKQMSVNGSGDIDLQAEKPIPFTGTYHCKLCDFSSTVRHDFHVHIVVHRDISTAHQCMECGECFVVKPSLVKHLQHFHFITDLDSYFDQNDCYDKKVDLMETVTNSATDTKLLEENQCRVCMQKFTGSVELNKHFRVHGMAFLMSNWK